MSILDRSRSALDRLGVLALGLVACVLLSLLLPPPAARAQVPGDAAYVMAYFRETLDGAGNSNNVHLAVSRDGLEWTALNDNRPVLVPTVGTRGIRDPFVHRLQDGTWVLLATDIPNGGNFTNPNPSVHVWTSRDLITWSPDRLLRLNDANPNSFTWAPAVHWDPARRQYGITFSADPVGGPGGTIMVSYTSDFVTATRAERFFDNGGRGGVIDSHVVPGVDGVNYLYYRGPDTGLVGARSSSLAPGSFAPYSTPPRVPGCVEAPTVVRSIVDPSSWWLWGDNYCPNARFEVWRGNIATGAWSVLDRRAFTAPVGGKHNSIHPISGATYGSLLSRYGGQSDVLIKSWNFPDRFVRHLDRAGRIDALPFNPQSDAQWRIVPGLSDPTAISIESVNTPGHYLRHSGFRVRLDPPDGTSGFRADATFTRVPGFADSTWSSFRSVNFPDRFLRHSDFGLVLEPVTDPTSRADATFRTTP